MARTNRYSHKQFRLAIEGSGGIKTAIAQRLGCTRQTVDNYLAKYDDLQMQLQSEREGIIDLAEAKLLKSVDGGDLRAVLFVLETLGKGRGWTKRTEITGADGEPLNLPPDVIGLMAEMGIQPSEVVRQFIELLREQAEIQNGHS